MPSLLLVLTITACGFQVARSRMVRRTGAEPGQTASVAPSPFTSHTTRSGVIVASSAWRSLSIAGGCLGSIGLVLKPRSLHLLRLMNLAFVGTTQLPSL